MLRRQEGYALRKIKEKNYLMPYGQKIADQRKGMVLNETGSFLWNFLEQPKEREEILEAVIQYYEIKEKERGEIEKQIGAFIDQLLTLGSKTTARTILGSYGDWNARDWTLWKRRVLFRKIQAFFEK